MGWPPCIGPVIAEDVTIGVAVAGAGAGGANCSTGEVCCVALVESPAGKLGWERLVVEGIPGPCVFPGSDKQ